MMKTFMKTGIALGLFSLAPLMSNVYALSCSADCVTTYLACQKKCETNFKAAEDFAPCMTACTDSFNVCNKNCK